MCKSAQRVILFVTYCLVVVLPIGGARLKRAKRANGAHAHSNPTWHVGDDGRPKNAWPGNRVPPVGAPCTVIITFNHSNEFDYEEVANRYKDDADAWILWSIGIISLSFGSRHEPCVTAWRDWKDVKGVLLNEFSTPTPECRLVDGADNKESDPYMCKCLSYHEVPHCKGFFAAERKFKLNDVLDQCAFPYCARTGATCDIVEGAINRSSVPQECKCKNDVDKVFCDHRLVADRKFDLAHVITTCNAKAHCAHPTCGFVMGSEPRDSEPGQCKCSGYNEKVTCDMEVVAERKFSLNEVLTNPKCNNPVCAEARHPCAKVVGAVSRLSNPSLCKCEASDEEVYCKVGDSVEKVADRKFNLHEVLDKCGNPVCTVSET